MTKLTIFLDLTRIGGALDMIQLNEVTLNPIQQLTTKNTITQAQIDTWKANNNIPAFVVIRIDEA